MRKNRAGFPHMMPMSAKEAANIFPDSYQGFLESGWGQMGFCPPWVLFRSYEVSLGTAADTA